MMQKKAEHDTVGMERETGCVQAETKRLERVQKERIRAFDRELMEGDPDRNFAAKILYIIMGTIGCFMTVFPFGSDTDPDLRVLHVLAWLFLGMAVLFRLQPYVYIAGDVGRISAVLAYIPADKALMRRVRRGYLRCFIVKLGTICFVLQQFGALLDGTWSAWNLIYPVGLILSLYLAGILYIGGK